MSITKNMNAISIAGVAGFELIVTGEANTGLITVLPELEKRGINFPILQLNLLNASDAKPEKFQSVQYNEKLEKQDQYHSVEIFHDDNVIETLKVKRK